MSLRPGGEGGEYSGTCLYTSWAVIRPTASGRAEPGVHGGSGLIHGTKAGICPRRGTSKACRQNRPASGRSPAPGRCPAGSRFGGNEVSPFSDAPHSSFPHRRVRREMVGEGAIPCRADGAGRGGRRPRTSWSMSWSEPPASSLCRLSTQLRSAAWAGLTLCRGRAAPEGSRAVIGLEVGTARGGALGRTAAAHRCAPGTFDGWSTRVRRAQAGRRPDRPAENTGVARDCLPCLGLCVSANVTHTAKHGRPRPKATRTDARTRPAVRTRRGRAHAASTGGRTAHTAHGGHRPARTSNCRSPAPPWESHAPAHQVPRPRPAPG